MCERALTLVDIQSVSRQLLAREMLPMHHQLIITAGYLDLRVIEQQDRNAGNSHIAECR